MAARTGLDSLDHLFLHHLFICISALAGRSGGLARSGGPLLVLVSTTVVSLTTLSNGRTMASQSIFSKAANFAHKVTIGALVGYTGYAAYHLTGQVLEGTGVGPVGSKGGGEEHPQAGFIATIRKKAQDEYEKYYDIGHREWYDKDDESWKKNLPRPGKDYPTGR